VELGRRVVELGDGKEITLAHIVRTILQITSVNTKSRTCLYVCDMLLNTQIGMHSYASCDLHTRMIYFRTMQPHRIQIITVLINL